MNTTNTSITIPATSLDKPPKFNWAVYSLRKGEKHIELESSFGDEWKAQQMFDRQYSKWGLPNTNFYLVDWAARRAIRQHKVF